MVVRHYIFLVSIEEEEYLSLHVYLFVKSIVTVSSIDFPYVLYIGEEETYYMKVELFTKFISFNLYVTYNIYTLNFVYSSH